jgi:hypothetical protein
MTIFKGFKTLAFNILALLPLAFEIAMQMLVDPEFSSLIPEHLKAEYALAVALINIWLRSVTTTPIGKAR